MRPIDADAFKKYIDAQEGRPFIGCTVGEAMKILIDEQPTVQPEKAQLSKEGTTSDTISRQAAIDAIEKMNIPEDMCVFEILSHIEVEIATLPTIQPEVLACGNGELVAKPEPQWIPVERGFPEDYTDVLVWFEYFRYGDYNCLYQTHGIGTYVANYNSWTVNHESGWKDLRVIAWIPLPKPYEGEGEQE